MQQRLKQRFRFGKISFLQLPKMLLQWIQVDGYVLCFGQTCKEKSAITIQINEWMRDGNFLSRRRSIITINFSIKISDFIIRQIGVIGYQIGMNKQPTQFPRLIDCQLMICSFQSTQFEWWPLVELPRRAFVWSIFDCLLRMSLHSSTEFVSSFSYFVCCFCWKTAKRMNITNYVVEKFANWSLLWQRLQLPPGEP